MARWVDRVRLVEARYERGWELRAVAEDGFPFSAVCQVSHDWQTALPFRRATTLAFRASNHALVSDLRVTGRGPQIGGLNGRGTGGERESTFRALSAVRASHLYVQVVVLEVNLTASLAVRAPTPDRTFGRNLT